MTTAPQGGCVVTWDHGVAGCVLGVVCSRGWDLQRGTSRATGPRGGEVPLWEAGELRSGTSAASAPV